MLGVLRMPNEIVEVERKKCHCCCNKNLEEYEATHFAEALILTCIDYRFIDDIVTFLEQDPRLSQRYDVSALAGASLGYNQKEFKYWGKTFIDILNLAIELHHIRQVIVFDHMDCGAYLLFYPGLKANSEEERLLHIKNINKFISTIRQKYPHLIYSGYIVNTDNTLERVTITQ